MTHSQKIIVIAEDEVLIRMLAVEILSDAGFHVLEAGNSADALVHLGTHCNSIHLLFTDINMPGQLTGLDLAHHVRRHWPHIALIITSGTLRGPAELPPGSVFVRKPYHLNRVIDHACALTA